MIITRTLVTAGILLLSQTAVHAQCARSRPVIRPHFGMLPGHSVHPELRHGLSIGISHHAYRGTAGYPTAMPPGAGILPEVAPDPNSVVFGGWSHTDELAAQLEVLMNEICLDLFYNYSHNPDFHATYTEAYQLFQCARYIHAAEHNYDRPRVQAELGGADALFHHIQDDVRGWTRIHRRQIGTLGIIAKMNLAEDTLHHLMEDVGVQLTPGLEAPPSPAALAVPPAPGTPAGLFR